MDYGCFVKIEDGIEGLIHNSELDWTNRNVKPSKILSVSQKIKFKIVNIDKETKRISLSYKSTFKNPWDKIKSQQEKKLKSKLITLPTKLFLVNLLTQSYQVCCIIKNCLIKKILMI